jgi:hypothetical protein
VNEVDVRDLLVAELNSEGRYSYMLLGQSEKLKIGRNWITVVI